MHYLNYFNFILSFFKFAGNLDDLSLIWDPDGRDLEIDLTSFQEGIKEWISDIRQRRLVIKSAYHKWSN